MTLYEELASLQRKGRRAALCTVVEVHGSVPQKPGSRMVVLPDGTISGTVGGGALEHEMVTRAVEMMQSGAGPELLNLDLRDDLGMACGGRVSVFVEPLTTPPTLLIFGAGHIGRDLAAMANRVGFRVTVVDERPTWADQAAFPGAEDVHARDPIEILDSLPFGDDTFVVLVSHSHAVDQRILKHVVGRPWRYLGMIASRRKRRQVFDELLQEGIDPRELERVHSPIGLKIGAVDPAEIAVSILAELVRVHRNAEEDPGTSFGGDVGEPQKGTNSSSSRRSSSADAEGQLK